MERLNRRMTAQRSIRVSERGLTLVELLVSLAILAIIVTSIGIAFDVGIRTFGAGGAGDRTAAAQDIRLFENRLGADVARAVCLVTPANGGPLGNCTALSFPTASSCTGDYICIAFPQPSAPPPPTSSTYFCHRVTYAFSAAAPAGVVRTETFGGSTSVTHITLDAITFAAGGGISVQPPAAPDGPWATVNIRLIKSANPGLSTAPTGSVQFVPLATLPASPLVSATC